MFGPCSNDRAKCDHIREEEAYAYRVENGDALTTLKRLDTNSVDLILTDPPYFLDGMDSGWGVERRREKRSDIVGGLPCGMKFNVDQGRRLQEFMEPIFEEAARVLKPGGFCIAFSQARLVHRMGVAAEDAGFEVRDLLGWTYEGQAKAASQEHRVRALDVTAEEKAKIIASLRGRKTPQLKPMIEPMILGQKPRDGTFVENWTKWGVGLVDVSQSLDGKFPGNLMAATKPRSAERGDGNDHPTVKPVRLLAHLIKLFTTEGQVVLDPFMGSGSHGVAAIQTGRRFIGSEINERYFKIAEDRIGSANPVQCGLPAGRLVSFRDQFEAAGMRFFRPQHERDRFTPAAWKRSLAA